MSPRWTEILAFLGRNPKVLGRIVKPHLLLLGAAPLFWIPYFTLAGPRIALRLPWIGIALLSFAAGCLWFRQRARRHWLQSGGPLLLRSRSWKDPATTLTGMPASPAASSVAGPVWWRPCGLRRIIVIVEREREQSLPDIPDPVRHSLWLRFPVALAIALPFVTVTLLAAYRQPLAVILFLSLFGFGFGIFLYSLLVSPLLDLKLLVEIDDSLRQQSAEGEGKP